MECSFQGQMSGCKRESEVGWVEQESRQHFDGFLFHVVLYGLGRSRGQGGLVGWLARWLVGWRSEVGGWQGGLPSGLDGGTVAGRMVARWLAWRAGRAGQRWVGKCDSFCGRSPSSTVHL